MQRRKEHDVMFKALPDADGQTGRFEAIVAAFGNVDLVGDRIVKGAFSKSIGKWRASGDPLPIIWSHNWGDPNAHVGFADPRLMEETDKGLKIVGQLDIDQPVAAQVYRLLKERRVKQWSFAYDIQRERPGRDRANELVELDILEAGPTLSGANPETETLMVKALQEAAEVETKAGRVFSARNEATLRQIRDLADDLLSSLERAEPAEEPEEEKNKEPEAKAETKPWRVEERDGEFCVVKLDDSSTVDCHATREEAEAQVRALYASEKQDAKSLETDEGRAEREAYKQRLEMLAVGL